jgi:septal ring factor EnvC (AmiA/AmiB activator)
MATSDELKLMLKTNEKEIDSLTAQRDRLKATVTVLEAQAGSLEAEVSGLMPQEE